jgi:hypothetical protein
VSPQPGNVYIVRNASRAHLPTSWEGKEVVLVGNCRPHPLVVENIWDVRPVEEHRTPPYWVFQSMLVDLGGPW